MGIGTQIPVGTVVTFNEEKLDIVLRGKVIEEIEHDTKPKKHVGYKFVRGYYPSSGAVHHRTFYVAIGQRLWRLDALDLTPVDLGAELARHMSDYINGMGNGVNAVVEPLTREHRTIQQGITELCSSWLKRCAKMFDEHDYDGRNEASAKLGKKFVEETTTQDRALPYI